MNGFNPEISLLTPNPSAQIHVFSGGGDVSSGDVSSGDVSLAPEIVRAIEDDLRGFLEDEQIRTIRECTKMYTDLTNILCDENIFDNYTLKGIYLILSEFKDDYPGFVPLQSGGRSRSKRHRALRKYR